MDTAEKVQGLEVAITRLDGRVSNLEEWQKRQNGSLLRLEEKMDGINLWLRGLMGGVIVSLALLVLQLARGL